MRLAQVQLTSAAGLQIQCIGGPGRASPLFGLGFLAVIIKPFRMASSCLPLRLKLNTMGKEDIYIHFFFIALKIQSLKSASDGLI